MKVKHKKRTLLLNVDYSPVSVISWKRAMVLHFLNLENNMVGAEVIEYYSGVDGEVISAGGQRFNIPAVLRLPRYLKIKNREVPFSRKNVFLRDKMTCLYCNEKFLPEELTYDHVIPRVKWPKGLGTPTNWENIVTSCKRCNRIKAGRTPKEAGMSLSYAPYKPNYINYVMGLSPWSSDIPDEWKTYLPRFYLE